MTDQLIDLEELKAHRRALASGSQGTGPGAASFARQVLALIEVAEAAQAFRTTYGGDYGSVPIENEDRLTAALAKFKEPT